VKLVHKGAYHRTGLQDKQNMYMIAKNKHLKPVLVIEY
jgi:hypothetical protein